MEIIIKLHEVTSMGLRYEALFNGQRICVSRTPLFSAARLLHGAGLPDHVVLTMRHEKSLFPSMSMTVGVAAGLTVRETPKDGPFIVAYNPATDSLSITPRVA
jgi:hypothetical protein